jgi:hypothetical protein
LAKKLAFFSKANAVIKFLHNLALFWVKNANFSRIFCRKYFKNHNIGPRTLFSARVVVDQQPVTILRNGLKK